MNIKKMMQQAQQMQQKLQEEIAEIIQEASSGGGMVTAEVNGNKELIGLKLEPDVVNAEDVEMLQDLIVAAINEAQHKVDEMIKEKLGGMAGSLGLNLPGM
jgi:DNA-binding YbaB/EbfC family protein